jgi:hypothetical protein
MNEKTQILEQIKVLTKDIMKTTYPYCGESNEELSELAEKINRAGFEIKNLVGELEKLI